MNKTKIFELARRVEDADETIQEKQVEEFLRRRGVVQHGLAREILQVLLAPMAKAVVELLDEIYRGRDHWDTEVARSTKP